MLSASTDIVFKAVSTGRVTTLSKELVTELTQTPAEGAEQFPPGYSQWLSQKWELPTQSTFQEINHFLGRCFTPTCFMLTCFSVRNKDVFVDAEKSLVQLRRNTEKQTRRQNLFDLPRICYPKWYHVDSPITVLGKQTDTPPSVRSTDGVSTKLSFFLEIGQINDKPVLVQQHNVLFICHVKVKIQTEISEENWKSCVSMILCYTFPVVRQSPEKQRFFQVKSTEKMFGSKSDLRV